MVLVSLVGLIHAFHQKWVISWLLLLVLLLLVLRLVAFSWNGSRGCQERILIFRHNDI